MRAARSVQTWLASPVKAFVAGPRFVAWAPSPKLIGVTLWGELETEHMPQMLRLVEAMGSKGLAPPVDVIVDGQDVTGFQDGAYRAALEVANARLSAFERLVGRQAIVMAAGVPGAVMAGLHHLVGPRYELRFFTRRDDAFAWLVPEPLRATISGVIDAARGEDPLLRNVRQRLAENLRGATLDSVAHELGLSSRTLQRELGRRDTSFRAEQQLARVVAAERLLADGGMKIEAVAREVGCASASHLATLVRRHRGRRPADLRRQ